MSPTRGSATIEIEASPEQVYDLLTDLSRIHELSPECYRAEWEGSEAGPSVGASFRGYNRDGKRSWDVRCVVVAAVPGKRWSFKVPADDGRDTLWSYDIEATESGCLVTERFDSPILADDFFVARDRHAILIENISQSLENLRRAVEA